MKRAVALACAFVALSLLSSAAGASTGTGGWVITKSSGNAFSGTFTNETASPINGVSVGTAAKAGNPITAFTIDAIQCQLYANYGSAYCYTALLIQPGATVLFHGTAQKALTPAGLQMCTSADRGMDNTCSDVAQAKAKAKAQAKKSKKSSATRATSPRKQAAAAARAFVLEAISMEANALSDLNKGETLLGSRNDLAVAQHRLEKALAQPFDAADIAGDLKSAIQDDKDAWNELDSKKPGRIARARKLITTAQGKKTIAALDLSHIAHS